LLALLFNLFISIISNEVERSGKRLLVCYLLMPQVCHGACSSGGTLRLRNRG